MTVRCAGFFSTLRINANLELVGSLGVQDRGSFKLIMSPDANLARDLK